MHLGSEIAAGRGNPQEAAARRESPLEGRSFMFNQPQAYGVGAHQSIVQPSPSHIIQLWQAYLANVDPMMKVIHAPTVQYIILGQIGRPSMAANEQALMSAIYLISAVSMTNGDCGPTLHQSRGELIHEFRTVTENALSAAGFVTTTDIIVLQALVLYLAALRAIGETPYVWSMTGLAIRIAGTIGLARDGIVLGLPPFECEMRRRLWWAIVYLDARTAELVGQDGDLLLRDYDVHLPANLNDTELFPNMQRIHGDRPAATDTIYVQYRATVATCLRAMPNVTGPVGTWQKMRATDVPVSEKLEVISAVSKRLDGELLRHCDSTVPLQKLTINSVNTMLTKMRLVGNVPLPNSPTTSSGEGYQDNIFEYSLKIVQLQLELWTEPSLQKWKWHWQGQFQWV